jgi:hypothetical protein
MSTASGSDRRRSRFFCRSLRERLLPRLQSLLLGGISPRRLAASLTLGALFGLLPVVWGSSLLCLATAYLLRLNPVAMQLANCAVFPLQIALFAPFFKLGALLFGTAPPSAGLVLDWRWCRDHPWDALEQLLSANGAAVAAWALTAAALFPLCYLMLRPGLARVCGPDPDLPSCQDTPE